MWITSPTPFFAFFTLLWHNKKRKKFIFEPKKNDMRKIIEFFEKKKKEICGEGDLTSVIHLEVFIENLKKIKTLKEYFELKQIFFEQ